MEPGERRRAERAYAGGVDNVEAPEPERSERNARNRGRYCSRKRSRLSENVSKCPQLGSILFEKMIEIVRERIEMLATVIDIVRENDRDCQGKCREMIEI